MNIFIHGGCVSRDIFSYPDSDNFNIVSYHTRSHIQSGLCKKSIISDAYKKLNSKFQQKQVKADFEKTFRDDLLHQEFDVFLMDFTGERNPLFVFNDGSTCTISKWLSDTGFTEERLDNSAGIKIKPFSDEMFFMWELAWKELIEILNHINRIDRLRIIKNHWAYETNNGIEFGGIFTRKYIEKANDYFDRIYARIIHDLKKSQLISPPKHLEIASAQHKWGLAPFHYIDEYYLSLLSELKSIDNQTI